MSIAVTCMLIVLIYGLFLACVRTVFRAMKAIDEEVN